MNTLTTLHDAFEELERQADAYRAGADESVGEPVAAHRRIRRQRLVLVAASVLVVAALAAGVGLVGAHRIGQGTGGPVPAGPATSVALSARPSLSTPSASAPSTSVRVSIVPAAFPRTAEGVAAGLRAVLGSSATITWSAPAGPSAPVIEGVLTDAATGRRGGFDLQTMIGGAGDRAQCEDAERSGCTPRTLPDGTSVAVGHESADGTLYLVNVVFPNGAGLLMHVSTNSNPKGGGQVLGTVPPLTTEQIVALLRSPLWHAT